MLRCIRFGEVLLDESFRTFLICNQCQTEFVEVPEFRVHLATTTCGKRLFEEEVIGLKFGAAQVTRSGKDKTYLLYNPADVQLTTTDPATGSETPNDGGDDAYLDLIKIEEELLDPRWYTDIGNTQSDVGSPQTAGNANKPMEYKELVEAVEPYVQFKENATKGKSSNIMVKRFPNKTSSPKAVVKNPILPVKLQQSTKQPSVRLLNPAAKRKLELTPKQVQFNDTVNVKYLINEKLSANAIGNKKLLTQNSENYENTDSAVLKRRKTINVPMAQANVYPDQQKLDVKRNSDVPKTTVGPTVVRNTAAITTTNTATTKLAVKPNNISSVAAGAKLKSNAPVKVIKKMPAPQTSAQAHIKNLVPNPVVAQPQINGTKNQATNSKQIVKNPVTYSRANSNLMKSEPNVNANKAMATAAKPPQRSVSVAITSAAQPAAIYTPSSQYTPSASKKVCNPAAIAAVKADVDTHQQTNDILSKLQTRGLQVKRTQPSIPVAVNAGQHNKTMELLQKLQSKGMKVKILNGKDVAASAPGATVTHLNAGVNLPITAPNAKIISNVGNATTAIGKPTKTILNNKLIIRKVN